MADEKKRDAGPVEEYARSIRMRADVWEKLDGDSWRCRRSSNRQIEAILIELYGIGDTGLRDLAPVQATVRAPDVVDAGGGRGRAKSKKA